MNEQFKVWKKTIPSLYQYITSFKPRYALDAEDLCTLNKCFVFTHKIVPQKDKGVLEASALIAMGSRIFQIDCILPLGLHVEEPESSSEPVLPDPQFGESPIPHDSLQPVWIFPGKNISSVQFMDGPHFRAVAMCTDGSLGWFKEGSENPLYVLDGKGPANSGSSTNGQSAKTENSKYIANEFAVSQDGSVIVRVQSVSSGNDVHCTLQVVDNSENISKVKHSTTLQNICVTNVKFHNKYLFGMCCSDNKLGFWDVRTAGKAIWWLNEDKEDGSLTCFETSPILDMLFLTGTDSGSIKLWDFRSVVAGSKGEPATELLRLYHQDNDPVVDIKFALNSPTTFVTIGKSGNIYHWDIEYMLQQISEEDSEEELPTLEDIQQQCLTFLHTGGGRRSLGTNVKRNTVAWHRDFSDVIGCIDSDGLVTIYKPYFGRPEESAVEDDDVGINNK
ncbi:HBR153Cp [Eremothecium sinecaudum]|uniref:HBR153Cp n=1 Tax=Eremothecium sinecaudum TaxID=45286 RepID=A0A120K160_9SACH|nr:HBR153Cp [Eremothecium sinecaudum]AMD19054.1 HBR153Cp [Eremothecium sinecaudum]